MTTIADADIRQQVLDTDQSFIVQAPAGSGKTELLTQRLLKLLSVVNQPEEIIAITFTRKAAAEMRARVVEALHLALDENATVEEHKKSTLALARAVIERDKKQQWGLLNNSNRLRIITIDSLAAFICRHMPLLSSIDPNIQISDNAQPLYQTAIKQLCQQAENNSELQQAITQCLLQLDNVMPYFESLLQQLLAKRDQWLPHIMPHYMDREALKQQLEDSLQHITQQTLTRVSDGFSSEQQQQLLELHCFAMQQLDPECQFETDPESLEYWQAISDMLLTQKNQWRSQITKRNGFPADKKPQKQQWKDFVAACQGDDALLPALIECRLCPPDHYHPQQWRVLDSLLTLLPQLVAQLQLIFSQQRRLDFVEIGLAANRALGDSEQPTDLALYLDYKIQHLLIDEFQDTSTTHFRLIEKIISEWTPDDNRSLFLVGDPMQSIYRFRQAEVGLFLHTQQHGIAQIKPTVVSLVSNFRSNAHLVEWFNQTFTNVFPRHADIDTGAINYHPAQACRPAHEAHKTQAYLLDESDAETEAQCVVDIIQQHNNPDEDIAILVKSRTQLIEIIPALRQANLAFNAVDIEPLLIQPEIEDVLTLTRALLHPADRVAWLALLRSPCCGLLLADLLVICLAAHNKPLWPTLLQYTQLTNLSTDAQQRLACWVPQIQYLLEQQGRLAFAVWVRNAWQALTFNQLHAEPTQQQNIETYFQLLQKLCDNNATIDLQQIEAQLLQAYTKTPSEQHARIHIMTIHKSKGLEFDHVIIPNLERGPVRDRPALLLWLERNQGQVANELLLAPIKSPEQQADDIYQYCKRIEQQKLDYENARLLYVAVTRAKQSLHLISTDIEKPKNGSFLALLQHALEPIAQSYQATAESHNELEVDDEYIGFTRLQKLPEIAEVTLSRILPDTQVIPQLDIDTLQIEQQLAPLTGTIIHQQLFRIAKYQLKTIDEANVIMQCLQLGLDQQQTESVLPTIKEAIQRAQQDQRGQWILDPHQEDQYEYEIQHRDDEKLKTFIIDRTFIDNGTRWIIDYKSAKPTADQTNDAFICTQKQQYFEQLQTYATLMSEIDPTPIRLGLYFPLCGLWSEWAFQTEALTVE
ncbi:MAG: UvrD-helicase domain-containing protein [Coxiellaceae bacterium]|nr:UvrD-helicase domain-containing protein [Coxiellaceae bacterium]